MKLPTLAEERVSLVDAALADLRPMLETGRGILRPDSDAHCSLPDGSTDTHHAFDPILRRRGRDYGEFLETLADAHLEEITSDRADARLRPILRCQGRRSVEADHRPWSCEPQVHYAASDSPAESWDDQCG